MYEYIEEYAEMRKLQDEQLDFGKTKASADCRPLSSSSHGV